MIDIIIDIAIMIFAVVLTAALWAFSYTYICYLTYSEICHFANEKPISFSEFFIKEWKP